MRANERVVSLDVFRGATVAAMLLVNNPGSWSHVYPPLLHAEWHGWTPTDLIFPFFLFVVGITTHMSLARLRRGAPHGGASVGGKILRRGLLIIALGLLLNWFPFFTWGQVPDLAEPSLGERVTHRWNHLRWSGVLQRIGFVYLVAAPLVWLLRARSLAIITTGILAGYALILLVLPVPESGLTGAAAIATPESTTAAWVDRQTLTTNHTWREGPWDPEGPLSTLPALATALLGALAGRLLTQHEHVVRGLRHLALAGVAAIAAGNIWSIWLPINKNLWTSSYVLFTAGAAALGLAATIWLVDVKGIRRHTGFFVTFGLNPLAAFAGAGLMARLTDSLIRLHVGGQSRTLHAVAHDALFRSWLPDRAASLAYALSFVLAWYLILKVLERRGWILKV